MKHIHEKQKKTTFVYVRVSPELRERLENGAERANQPFTWYVRGALERAVEADRAGESA